MKVLSFCSWSSHPVCKWASVLSSSFILNKFNNQCWTVPCIAVGSCKFLCSTFWSEWGKNTIASLIWCLMEQLLQHHLRSQNWGSRQQGKVEENKHLVTSLWTLLKVFPQLKKPGSITFCNQEFMPCKDTSSSGAAGWPAKQTMLIYTKYRVLWWHGLLPHGMITETRNVPEPNTVLSP